MKDSLGAKRSKSMEVRDVCDAGCILCLDNMHSMQVLIYVLSLKAQGGCIPAWGLKQQT